MNRKCVGIIIKCDNNKLLLLDHVKLGGLAFAGGKMDETDKDILYTCKRELEEELGIIPIVVREFKQYDNYEYKDGFYNGHVFDLTVYIIEEFAGTVTNKEPSKHLDILYMTPEEILKSDKSCISTKMIVNDYILERM